MAERRVVWLRLAVLWSFVAVVLASQTWLSMFTHGHSMLRLIAYHMAVWSFWALLTPALFALSVRVPLVPFSVRNALIHAAVAAPLIAAHITIWVALTLAIRPYDDMTVMDFAAYFPNSALMQVSFEIAIYVAVILLGHVAELRARTSRLEQSLAGARLHALELQIQPHFLFNTMNAISALVRARKNAEAVEVIAGLSDLLRYTLDHAGDGRVPLDKEVEMMQRYLDIQRLRFADRLTVSVEIADDARRAAVPTLILQPLAENAIRHGVTLSAATGRIEVRAYRRDHTLEIEIFNTGRLGTAPRRVGLTNTEERLRELYGDRGRFDLRNERGGVVAQISIPWSEAA